MTATVPIPRVDLLARLYDGAEIQSRRTMPFPHKFYLGEVELPEFVIQDLVDAKILDHLPQDVVWDHITYWVKDREPLRRELLKAFPKGWGRCEKCGELLKLGAKKEGKTLAPKHGHHFIAEGVTKKATPPCEGSGLPLAGTVYVAA